MDSFTAIEFTDLIYYTFHQGLKKNECFSLCDNKIRKMAETENSGERDEYR